MASHRRIRDTHQITSGIVLVAIALIATGCRSTGGVSHAPGMGWLAGSKPSGAAARTEMDPTVNFPPPSSATTPQTLADAERPAPSRDHQQVTHEALPNTAGTVVQTVYPSTGYAPIGANPQGMRPETNSVTGRGPNANAAPGSEYVQQGAYSAAGVVTPGAATTWGSAPSSPDPNSVAAVSSSTSIYGNAGPSTAEYSAPGGSDSVYGSPGASPPPYAPHDTTWGNASVSTVPGRGESTSSEYPGGTPGSVAQASFDGPIPGGSSPNPPAPMADVRTATANQPWLPGSTATYSLR